MMINKQQVFKKPEQKTKTLHSVTLDVSQLKAIDKKRMYDVLCRNYNKTTELQFLEDLSKKDFVILLIDNLGIVQGFSTQAIFSIVSGMEKCKILFSGDTIINPKYWGTQELVKEFGRLVGRLIDSESMYKWYWFLISKGHRTYSYLPLFFTRYHPGLSQRNDKELKPILHEITQSMFGDCWNPETGLIIFPSSMGELTPELSEGSYKRQHNKHTKFFLDKNPEFYKGHELACLAELTLENIHPRLHRYIDPNFPNQ